MSFVVDDRRHVRTRMMKSNETERERERAEGKKEGEREGGRGGGGKAEVTSVISTFLRVAIFLFRHLIYLIDSVLFSRRFDANRQAVFFFVFFSHFLFENHLSCVAACYNRAFARHSFIAFFFNNLTKRRNAE